MPSVEIPENGSFESYYRRFKRAVEKAGIPQSLRENERHIKRSLKRKQENAAAKKRAAKRRRKEKEVMDKERDRSRGRG